MYHFDNAIQYLTRKKWKLRINSIDINTSAGFDFDDLWIVQEKILN